MLEYNSTIVGQAKTITYPYDAANQLTTAQEGSGTTWQYHYDGNGSLMEMTPGGQAGNGTKRYRYNAAGQLTKVETHDGTAYQPQAEMAYEGQRLSVRAYHRVLKLARTIADLAGCERIGASHLAEALQYRPRMNEG